MISSIFFLRLNYFNKHVRHTCEGIMVVVFIKTNIQTKIKTTTMITYSYISKREMAIIQKNLPAIF